MNMFTAWSYSQRISLPVQTFAANFGQALAFDGSRVGVMGNGVVVILSYDSATNEWSTSNVVSSVSGTNCSGITFFQDYLIVSSANEGSNGKISLFSLLSGQWTLVADISGDGERIGYGLAVVGDYLYSGTSSASVITMRVIDGAVELLGSTMLPYFDSALVGFGYRLSAYRNQLAVSMRMSGDLAYILDQATNANGMVVLAKCFLSFIC